MFWAGMPRRTDSAPCGSRSMSSTRRPYSVSAAPRLMVEVVLPTPPFWLHIAMIWAGPCSVMGRGSGSGRCRALAGSCWRGTAPISGPLSCGRAAAEAAVARVAMGLVASPSCPMPVDPGAVSRPARSGDEDAREYDTSSQGGTPGVMSTWRPMTTSVTAQAEAAADPAKKAVEQLSAARPRVTGRVHLAQPINGDECVDLCGRHRRVAEQLLDDAHVGAAVEQVGGERVPQRVRGHLGRHSRPLRGRPQERPCALPRQRPAADVEEPRSPAHAAPALRRQRRPRPHEVALDGPQCVAADGNDPLLATLAGQPRRRLSAVEVVDGQPDRLG